MQTTIRLVLIVILLAYCVNGQGARGGGGARGGIRGGGTRTSSGGSCSSESCTRTGIIVGSVVGGVFGVAAVALIGFYIHSCLKGKPKQTNVEFIQENTTEKINLGKDPFQYGFWSSRYHQYNKSHGPHSLCLYFNRPSGTVNGQGTDDVGEFRVDGVFSAGTGRLALTKTYRLGTGNQKENYGHSVTIQLVWNDEKSIFEGKWYIQTSKYRGSDKFELEPVKKVENLADQMKY